MVLIFLIVLLGIPALEIFVFAEVGGIIGGWATVGLTLLTAALGALLFRTQGTAVLQRAQETLRQEQSPLAEIIDGVGLLLAAVLLFLPGFVTDVAGFLLFIPPLRIVLIGFLFRGLARSADSNVWIVRTGSGKASGSSPDRTVIDGEYEDLTEDREDDSSDRKDDGDRTLPPR
ncbi:FxsA family protein [Nisaea sediminum]|uniref:FxsA family protein n=1 Tax=Nisaea sediminum TaxID=2775867 RepID=UPI001866FC4B|nr:FxsA family protein [Nisaea sediminum]